MKAKPPTTNLQNAQPSNSLPDASTTKMDTSYLKGWNSEKEQQKAKFMEHMYQCSGRTNGLFTGLWQDFCMNEAGPLCRDQYFERLEAIKQFKQIEMQQKKVNISKEEFVPTLHD